MTPEPPIQITSDWGKVFGLVWHNQGCLDPRGMTGFIDLTSLKTWIVFPKKTFPFFNVSYWRFELETDG